MDVVAFHAGEFGEFALRMRARSIGAQGLVMVSSSSDAGDSK